MNDGDVYVLDTKEIIYVWTGRNSNNMEKLQGAKVGIPGLGGRVWDATVDVPEVRCARVVRGGARGPVCQGC